jgi:hypothetical protein
MLRLTARRLPVISRSLQEHPFLTRDDPTLVDSLTTGRTQVQLGVREISATCQCAMAPAARTGDFPSTRVRSPPGAEQNVLTT